MPKRPYSFDDYVSRQFKMHVGDKEISNGVTHTGMKEIYDKTNDRLYKGINMWYKSVKCTPKVMTNKVLSTHKQVGEVCCNENNRKPMGNNRCYYCEKPLCLSCKHECHLCSHIYCANCSIEVYDSENEAWLCLNCF